MYESVRSVVDGRRISAKELETFRRRIIELHLKGQLPRAIAKKLGFSQSGLNRIIRNFKILGETSFYVQKRGPRGEARRAISPECEVKLCQLIRNSLPIEHGLMHKRWTGIAVKDLALSQLNLEITDRTGFNYLMRWKHWSNN